jgi:tRNA A37 threonylcarbamoyltransferase TsaD
VATVALEAGPGTPGPTAAGPPAAASLGVSSDVERPFIALDHLGALEESGRLWADAD